MVVINNLKKMVDKLRDRAAKATKETNICAVTGFTAAYTLSVHERVEMKWKGLPRSGEVKHAGFDREGKRLVSTGHAANAGKGFYWDPLGRAQAKFLEAPAREFANELGEIAAEAAKKGASYAHCLLLPALRLQREAMQLVPVDTGNLKASAFTRLEPLDGGSEDVND